MFLINYIKNMGGGGVGVWNFRKVIIYILSFKCVDNKDLSYKHFILRLRNQETM